MNKAIARNNRNTFIALGFFIALFGLISAPFFYFGINATPTNCKYSRVASSYACDTRYSFNDISFFTGVGIILFAIAYAFFQYYNADKLAIKASGAVEITPGQFPVYEQVCQELSIGYGLPLPKLYVIDDASSNAFATGRDPEHSAVAVTTGILARMDRYELEGVLAHEFAHIKNHDIRLSMIVFGMVAAIALICDMFRMFGYRAILRGNRKNDNGPVLLIFAVIALLTAVILPILSAIIQLFISRQREYMADATGADLMKNPIPLAKALEKLQDPSIPDMRRQQTATAHLYFTSPLKKQGFVNRLFDTHPPLEKRIARLLDMKDKYSTLPSTKLKNIPLDEKGRPIEGAKGRIDERTGEIVWDVNTQSDQ